jgi:WD40 repeat protein
MIIGYENIEVKVRHVYNPKKYLSIKMHDRHNGKITAMRFDKEEKYLMTSSKDGLIYIYQIDKIMHQEGGTL